MHQLTIRLLGDFAAVDHRGNTLSIGNTRLKALVAYLALRLEEGGTVSEVGDLIFADGSSAIHVADLVGELRYALRYIPGDLVLVTGQSVRFNPEAVSVDATQFEELAASPAINSTREAAERYAGNLLEGYHSGIASFDEWLGLERLRFWRAG